MRGKPFVDKDSTNLIERFRGTMNDRTNVIRGFKNMDNANLLTDAWLVHYNFFRPNMASDNKTPAVVAGLKYDCQDWADVVGYKKAPIVQILEPTLVESA